MMKLFPNNEIQYDEDMDQVIIEEDMTAEEKEQTTDLDGNILLQTIKVPTNLAQLTKRLPKANYKLDNFDKEKNLYGKFKRNDALVL